jgi:hypothetical protein
MLLKLHESENFTVFSNTDDIISAGKRKLISTGISVSWSGLDEENYYLRVAHQYSS